MLERERERERENLCISGLRAEKVWDYENGFMMFSHPTRISKLIAHYTLYSRCINLPGSIIEFGVYKGSSLFQIATFRDMLETSYSREIFAFDAFGEFPSHGITDSNDIEFIKEFEDAGGDGIDVADAYRVLKYKGFNNIFLIQGDVRKTFPEFLSENLSARFNFVHLDLDLYEPTAAVLEDSFLRMVKGGIMMIDDYNAVAGATMAVDEFLSRHPECHLEKLPYIEVPAFIVK